MHSDHTKGAQRPFGATSSRFSVVLMHIDSSVRIRRSPYDNSTDYVEVLVPMSDIDKAVLLCGPVKQGAANADPSTLLLNYLHLTCIPDDGVPIYEP
jgi:hypothetical protein